jgi:hypothetical protein
MKLFSALMIVSLTSCTTLSISRELRENCVRPNSTCPIDLAKSANLEILRANGATFIVECETEFHPLDQEYRDICHRELTKLAEILSAKGKGAISTISFSDMELEDQQGCIETTTGDHNIYSIKASIKLHWITN